MRKTIPSQDRRNAKLALDPTCRSCGEAKTVDDFPKNAVDYECHSCKRKRAVRDYHKRRARISAEELDQLKRKINERQNKRRQRSIDAMSDDELRAYRSKVNAENFDRRNAVKNSVYMAYGGYVCACCGETEKTFLSIDHINNDGAKHKREFKLHTGEQLYRWIVRNGFPPGFQILCMNCQWGKRNNNGVCPHKASKV